MMDSPPQCVPQGRRGGADRKGKSPLVHEEQPFGMFFSTSMGYPTIPIPPIYVVWAWLFGSPLADRNEVLFHRASRKAKWSDFRTLKEGTNVSRVIVDAWCLVLNARERYRRWSAPSRLFATMAATIGIGLLWVFHPVATRGYRGLNGD